MEQISQPKLGNERQPPNGGKGRPKGATNLATRQLKEMILGALDEAGGLKYLAAQAEKNPAAFLTLIGKVLPTTLAGDRENPVVIEKFKLAPLE
jgi:hypothetical protein